MLDRANEHSRVWKNYNAFWEKNVDETDEVNCKVCDSICDIKDNDFFYCPRNDEQWHWETLALLQELNDICSPSLRKLIQKDIDKARKENL